MAIAPECPQVDLTTMPGGQPAVLLQVKDSGPGLKGVDYRLLFDPTSEFGEPEVPVRG
jgi:hypothetical protein